MIKSLYHKIQVLTVIVKQGEGRSLGSMQSLISFTYGYRWQLKQVSTLILQLSTALQHLKTYRHSLTTQITDLTSVNGFKEMWWEALGNYFQDLQEQMSMYISSVADRVDTCVGMKVVYFYSSVVISDGKSHIICKLLYSLLWSSNGPRKFLIPCCGRWKGLRKALPACPSAEQPSSFQLFSDKRLKPPFCQSPCSLSDPLEHLVACLDFSVNIFHAESHILDCMILLDLNQVSKLCHMLRTVARS